MFTGIVINMVFITPVSWSIEDDMSSSLEDESYFFKKAFIENNKYKRLDISEDILENIKRQIEEDKKIKSVQLKTYYHLLRRLI